MTADSSERETPKALWIFSKISQNPSGFDQIKPIFYFTKCTNQVLISMNALPLWFESLPKSLLLFSGKILSPAFHELSPGAASKRDETSLKAAETTGQAELGNEPTSHFHFGPQKQRKTIMRKVQQRLSLGSQGDPTSISDFIPWQVLPQALKSSCPFLQWAMQRDSKMLKFG